MPKKDEEEKIEFNDLPLIGKKAIAINENELYIPRLETYEIVIEKIVEYALQQFGNGLKVFKETGGKTKCPYEDWLILHSYLTGIAPFIHLTKNLLAAWKEYAELVSGAEEGIHGDVHILLHDNFSLNPSDVSTIERYLEENPRGQHRSKTKKRQRFKQPKIKYNGTSIFLEEGKSFELKDKIYFLEASSPFKENEGIQRSIKKGLGELLYDELKRKFSLRDFFIVYALITELGPVAHVDTKEYLGEYKKMYERHKKELEKEWEKEYGKDTRLWRNFK